MAHSVSYPSYLSQRNGPKSICSALLTQMADSQVADALRIEILRRLWIRTIVLLPQAKQQKLPLGKLEQDLNTLARSAQALTACNHYQWVQDPKVNEIAQLAFIIIQCALQQHNPEQFLFFRLLPSRLLALLENHRRAELCTALSAPDRTVSQEMLPQVLFSALPYDQQQLDHDLDKIAADLAGV